MHVLFVCTGNQCRSPLAERLLRVWADQALGDAGTALEVGSAGVDARDGEPMDASSAQALRELGGDPAGFRAHRLTADDAGADLVLTMNRWHRRKVLVSDPRGLRRTFTLGEAAALLDLADLTGIELLPLPDRVRELSARLHAARPQRADSGADDVRDPIGQPLDAHREAAGHIAALLRPIADVLLSPAEGRLRSVLR